MHTYLFAAAWLFAGGFAYNEGDEESNIAYWACCFLAPLLFPFALGKRLNAWMRK